jgi:hypothetical protein
LLYSVSSGPVHAHGRDFEVTLSGGLASVAPGEPDLWGAIGRADAALYRSKDPVAIGSPRRRSRTTSRRQPLLACRRCGYDRHGCLRTKHVPAQSLPGRRGGDRLLPLRPPALSDGATSATAAVETSMRATTLPQGGAPLAGS